MFPLQLLLKDKTPIQLAQIKKIILYFDYKLLHYNPEKVFQPTQHKGKGTLLIDNQIKYTRNCLTTP